MIASIKERDLTDDERDQVTRIVCEELLRYWCALHVAQLVEQQTAKPLAGAVKFISKATQLVGQ